MTDGNGRSVTLKDGNGRSVTLRDGNGRSVTLRDGCVTVMEGKVTVYNGGRRSVTKAQKR